MRAMSWKRNYLKVLIYLIILLTLISIYFSKSKASSSSLPQRTKFETKQGRAFKYFKIPAGLSGAEAVQQELKFYGKSHTMDWFGEAQVTELKGGDPNLILMELSKIFGTHLTRLQNPGPCSQIPVAIQCGHDAGCGLGCQIHHRVGCMLLSYTYNFPLIHDANNFWPYRDPWLKYLKPFGANCTPSSVGRVIPILWASTGGSTSPIFPTEGTPIPKLFGQLLAQNHKNPFLWLLGQLTGFVYQVNEATKKVIDELANSDKLSKKVPLIGMHVRRTDKFGETTIQPAAVEFMKTAQDLKKMGKFREGKIDIFIATDDCRVLEEFRNREYSKEWRFVSWCKATGRFTRWNHLFEIIRDISVLVESDHVICTHSSNVCRLILMIKSSQVGRDPAGHVTSLDGDFSLVLSGLNSVPHQLNLV